MVSSSSEEEWVPGSCSEYSSSSSSSDDDTGSDEESSIAGGEAGDDAFKLWESAASREQWEASYLAQDSAWRVTHGYGIDADCAADRITPVAAGVNRGAARGRDGNCCVLTRGWALVIAFSAIAAAFWRIDKVALDLTAPDVSGDATRLAHGTAVEGNDSADPSLLSCCKLFQMTVHNRSMANATAAACATAIGRSHMGSAAHVQALVRRADLHSLMQDQGAALKAYAQATELTQQRPAGAGAAQ